MATLVFNHEEIAARGWAWTAYDWDEQRLFNYIGDTQNTYPIWNATPLVALDVYEHAYFLDYQTDRASYIDAFFANLDWATVNDWVQRYQVPLREGLASEPVGEGRVRGRLCACQLRAQLAHDAVPLGDHVVRVDRLQVDLAREEEVSIAQCRIGVQHSLQREADRVLHEARLEVRVLDDEQLVRALEELEDRSAHRRLDDLAELLRIHPRVAADEQRPDPTLVVRRERDELEDALDVARREARLEQAVSRALPDEALRAGAGVDPRRLDSDHPPDAALRGRRDPDQSEHRLGGEARHGRVALDGVPRSDPRLRPAGALPLDDLARDVRRQLLDEERLLEHDVLDHLLEELREAGHVDALLRRVEVDGALDVGGDQLLAGPVPDPDRLRDAGDPRAGQAEANLGLRCLEVFAEQVAEIGHPDGIMAVAPNLRNTRGPPADLRPARFTRVPRPPDAARDGFGVRAHAAAPRLARGPGRPLRRHDRRRLGADGRAARPPRGRGTDRGRPLRRPGARGRLAQARRRGRGASGRPCGRRGRRSDGAGRSAVGGEGTRVARRVRPPPRRVRAGHARRRRRGRVDRARGRRRGRHCAWRRPQGLRRRCRLASARRDGCRAQGGRRTACRPFPTGLRRVGENASCAVGARLGRRGGVLRRPGRQRRRRRHASGLAKQPREAAVFQDPTLRLTGRAVVDRVLLEVHARDRRPADMAGLGELLVHAIRLLVVRSALAQLEAADELGVDRIREPGDLLAVKVLG